ncbi:hypothetical protein QQ045_018051 [Rhodiola kirilowii]
MGDFNEVMFSYEVKGRRERQAWQMNNFRSCLPNCGLTDLGYDGDRFTYSNRRRGDDEVSARLDRVVVNQAWRSLFPNAVVKHSIANSSDHTPIVLFLSERAKVNKEKIFRFEPMWRRHRDFKDRVREFWKEQEGVYDFAEKLRRCMQSLNKWNWSAFGDVRKKLHCLKERLQLLSALPRTQERVEEEAQLSDDIDEWLEREELLWRQRSRAEKLIHDGCWIGISYMSASSVAANISNVSMLNGTNFKDWKENIMIVLGCMDLYLALREPKTDAITDTSSESDQVYKGTWERSNRLNLMIIRHGIPEAFRSAVPDEDITAKDYLAAIEQRFVKNDKAETSVLLGKLIAMRYSGKVSLRSLITVRRRNGLLTSSFHFVSKKKRG